MGRKCVIVSDRFGSILQYSLENPDMAANILLAHISVITDFVIVFNRDIVYHYFSSNLTVFKGSLSESKNDRHG